MKCYLAHPVTDYGGSERQRQAIAAIEARGWTVENPDHPIHQAAYKEHGMSHFAEVVEGCDKLAFLPFPNGKIGAGVGREIETALRVGIPVYDLENEFSRISMMPMGLMTVDETREEIFRLRILAEAAE